MPGDENQRAIFKFLLDHLRSQQPFAKEHLRAVTDWSKKSFDTYWPKQLKALLVADGGQFRVAESFRPYSTWKKFQRHVSQVRHVSSDYTYLAYPDVLIFEFFMPLANEEHLRLALDALFYKDWVLLRLKTIDQAKLAAQFPKCAEETPGAYLERICEWISKNFGGYSIYHVNGRFRAEKLSTTEEVVDIQEAGGRYLVDETTAVVRFIFYCGEPSRKEAPLSSGHFGEDAIDDVRVYPAELARLILQP